MATTFIKLYEGQPGIADTTLYTCPANSIVRILAATISNVGGAAARYFEFNLVPSGSSVGDDNIIVPQMTLGIGEPYILPELVGHVMEAGDLLSAIAEAANELTVHISGVLFTA